MSARGYRPAAASALPHPLSATAHDYAHNLLRVAPASHLLSSQHAYTRRNTLVEAVSADARATWGDPQATPGDETDAITGGLRLHLERALRREPARPFAAPLATNLRLVGDLLRLDPAERAVLQFTVAATCCTQLGHLLDDVFGNLSTTGIHHLIAEATGHSIGLVARACRPVGRLRASGLVEWERDHSCDFGDTVALRGGLHDALDDPDLDAAGLRARFVPQAPPPTLAWADFAHLGAPLADIRALLAAALEQRQAGIHVLFHGPSGTGKTEVAGVLAAALGQPLALAASADDDGAPIGGAKRLASWVLGQRLLPPGEGLVLFDEMEDLFAAEEEEDGRGIASKKYFNGLLEANPIPTIWVTNSLRRVDVAYLRRFSYALEFRPVSPRIRQRILRRHLGADHPLPAADADAIAAAIAVSPGQLHAAVRTLDLMGGARRGAPAALERVLLPIAKVVQGAVSGAPATAPQAPFRPELAHASCDLVAVADALVRWRPGGPSGGVSLCLHGPPGTGKSAFADYLAGRTGRALHRAHAASLLGSFVGETEANIAAAFAASADADAILLFDEADSFLCDRRDAQHSWEVTAVNEFLQRLEAHRGIVVCTTNLFAALDEAALRRFVFKISFAPLLPMQALRLFEELLADPAVVVAASAPGSTSLSPTLAGELAQLSHLTPGDFAAVGRRARIEGPLTAADLLARLSAEVSARCGARWRLGFRVDKT